MGKAMDSVAKQLQKFKGEFPSIPYSGLENMLRKIPDKAGIIENLLIIPPAMVSTKAIFSKIDLGRSKDNTWFLDITKMYDIVDSSHTQMYFLESVNCSNVFLLEEIKQFGTSSPDSTARPTPLTIHESAVLLFQYPELLSGKINGVQTYGSRFSDKKDDSGDILELYKKGNRGNAFLKLAREKVPYEDDSKLIPFAQNRYYFAY